jgi:hypothetical protein
MVKILIPYYNFLNSTILHIMLRFSYHSTSHSILHLVKRDSSYRATAQYNMLQVLHHCISCNSYSYPKLLPENITDIRYEAETTPGPQSNVIRRH